MKNPFSEATRFLFADVYECWECGCNQNLSLHHTFGRISNSPINASPLCLKSHEKGDVHSPEKREKYLLKTLEYLKRIGYQFTQKDKEFIIWLKNEKYL